jgi:hypothetical protein
VKDTARLFVEQTETTAHRTLSSPTTYVYVDRQRAGEQEREKEAAAVGSILATLLPNHAAVQWLSSSFSFFLKFAFAASSAVGQQPNEPASSSRSHRLSLSLS